MIALRLGGGVSRARWIGRRDCGGGGGGGRARAPPAAAPPGPREKGPRVWLDLDQQELDDAYDQSKYAANLAQIVKRYATNSEQVRARLGAPDGAAPARER